VIPVVGRRPGFGWSLVLAILLIAKVNVQVAGAQEGELRFTAADSGVDFVHVNGRTDRKHLPETMGSGAAWTDYDRDGDQDLYLVQSGWLPGTLPAGEAQPANRLYRNDGSGGFTAVAAGVEDDGYGMGASLADYDSDGWPDLFVTNFGVNTLYRNNGDGTFERQSSSGVEDPRWSSSSAWGDLDGDHDADLFVVNYVEYDLATATTCGQPADGPAYCHIDLFDGLADSLFRNNGDGTFTDVAATSGVANPREGKGLGVVLGDLDGDRQPDIFVANDTQQNFLYANLGALRFEDQGLFSGTGYSGEGKAQAGMGADMSDLDGDLASEILVTNFAFENNNLYRQFGPGAYLDEAFALGLGEPGLGQLAFGIVSFDADGDGDRDIAVANGHILDTVENLQDGVAYRQPNHLFRNTLIAQRAARQGRGESVAPGDWRPTSGLFELADPGPDLAVAGVSRGLAVGDANNDGRPDLVVTNSGAPAALFRNDSAGGQRLVIRVVGRTGNRDALGARVEVRPIGGAAGDGAVDLAQLAEVRAGASYASQSATDLYFGLGSSPAARIEVTWPDGSSAVFDGVGAGQIVLLAPGREPLLRALATE
jgi:hypothetical protein